MRLTTAARVTIRTASRLACATLLATALVFASACGNDDSQQQHVDTAREFLHQGKAREAYIELLNAIQQDSEMAEPRFLLGRLQLATGNALEAKPALITASRLGWPADEVKPLLAQAYLETGDFEALYRIATTDLNAHAIAQVLAIQALGKLGEGDPTAARTLAQEALDYEETSADAWVAIARIALQSENYSAAVNALNTAIKGAPTHSGAWELLGQTQASIGQFEAARESFGQAADHATLSINARFNRALLDIQLGHIDAARQDIALLQAMAPQAPATSYVQGLLHLEDAQHEMALRALEAAKPLSDNYPLIDFNLATVHLYAGDTHQARELALDYYERYPNAVEGRKLLAALEIVKGDFDTAQDLLQPVLDKNAAELEALHLMAAAQARHAQGEQALGTYFWISQLQKTVSATPDGGYPLIEATLAADPPQRGDDGQAPEDAILEIARRINSKDFAAAISAAQALRWNDTTTLNGHHVLARAYLSAGQDGKARETLASALASDPADAVSNLILAELALRNNSSNTSKNKKNTAEAEQRYRTILDKDAHHLQALLRLADLELREGNDSAFTATLRQALHAHPQALTPRIGLATYAIREGNPQEVDILIEPLSALQKSSPQVIYLQLLAQMARSQPPLNAQAVANIARAPPGSEAFAYALVNAAAAQSQTTPLKIPLQNTLLANPNHLASVLALAMIAKLENDATALRFLSNALEKLHPRPDSPVLLQLRAAARASDGQFDIAQSLAERALVSIPSTALVLELSSYQLAAGNPEDARKTLEDWLTKHPEANGVRLRLAQYFEQQGETLPAALHYGAILKQQPDNLIALNNLAWLTRLQNPSAALALIQRAQQIAPEQPDILDTLGVILGITGQPELALAKLNKALKLRPKRPDIRFHRAEVLAQLGRRQAAIKEVRLLLQEFPDFPMRAAAEEMLAQLEN